METQKNQETVYGFGTIIYSQEEWTTYANLYNDIVKQIGFESKLDPDDTYLEGKQFPLFIAVEKYEKSELEASVKNGDSRQVEWKDIELMLKLADEGFPICMFKCDPDDYV